MTPSYHDSMKVLTSEGDMDLTSIYHEFYPSVSFSHGNKEGICRVWNNVIPHLTDKSGILKQFWRFKGDF